MALAHRHVSCNAAEVCAPTHLMPAATSTCAATTRLRRHLPSATHFGPGGGSGTGATGRSLAQTCTSQPRQPCMLTARRCRCRVLSAVSCSSSLRPGSGAGAAPHRRNSGAHPPPPAAASGSAPAGPTGRPSPPQPGAASSSGHPFNPRYQHPHPHHHAQGGQQLPLHHGHPHSHPHAHQQGSTSTSGRSLWATPGPLAPAGKPQPGPNPRYEPPQARRPPGIPPSSLPPSTKPAPSEESRLAAAGAGVCPSSTGIGRSAPPPSSSIAATAAMSVTGAARQPPPPRPGPHSSNGHPPTPHPPQHPHTHMPGEDQPRPSDVQRRQQPQPQPQSRDDGREAHAGGERTQLERLFVKDFALVSEQVVRLGPGLNVITGESGSGKSVLVEAFSQVLGAPAPQECVRAPAEVAIIEGTFLVGEEQREAVRQLMSACGLPQRALLPLAAVDGGAGGHGDGSGADAGCGAFRLTVRREISQAPAGGLRSRVFLNGAATSLRVLRELGALLVDTNGQHSSMSLRDSATQLDLLDRIAGTAPLADSYCAALARLREVEGRLDELDELDDEAERATMQKLVDAVAKLRIQPGEERELRRTLKKMEARRAAVEQCGLVRMALCGEAGAGGVTDALRTIEAQLNAILAQEEQNRAAAAAKGPKGKEGGKAADGDAAAAAAAAAGSAAGEDEAGEEEEEGEEGGAAAGASMMEDALEQVAAAKDMLASAETMVRAYARRYQFSQADHDATAERLARIERLMKQASAAGFGAGGGGGGGLGRRGGGARIVSTEQLLEVAEECSAKLAAYYEMEGQREEWEAQLQSLVGEVRGAALQLSSRRRAAAAALRSAVESCLRELAMGGSRFDVRIGWAEERPGVAAEGLYVGEEEAEEAGVAELGGMTYVMGPRGLDQVEFLLAAGPAEPLRPLAAVASGGESARVMLALKAAPAQAAAAATGAGSAQAESPAEGAAASPMAGGGVPIMILDELDSGIGARLGSAVGSILARMALPTHGSNTQIICVTHLPQVACFAAHHIKVQKELPSAAAPEPAEAARVTTAFLPLMTFEERSEEVAAMLGLDRSVAEEMLWAAQSQVAAMYPPGTFPDGFLRRPAAAAAAAVAASRSAAGGADDGADPPGTRAGTARRVVQDALRGGGGAAAAADDGGVTRPAGSSAFSVVVAPAMDSNAALLGGESAAAAATAGGLGDDGGGDDSDEDAELSAQLLAGVEAAAMQHLKRMEAQAKAAAAAAAAAAAVVPSDTGVAPTLRPLPSPPTLEVAATAANPVTEAVSPTYTAAVGLAVGRGGGLDRLAVGRSGADSSSSDNSSSNGSSGGRDVDELAGVSIAALGSGSAAPPPLPSAWRPEPTPAPMTGAAAAGLTVVATNPMPSPSDFLGEGSEDYSGPKAVQGLGLEVAVDVAESSEAPDLSDPKPVASSFPDRSISSKGGDGGGFVVAVQPSRSSPLPYNFGGGGDDNDDEDDAGAKESADAGPAVGGEGDHDGGSAAAEGRWGRDPAITYEMYDRYDAEHRARQQDVAEASYGHGALAGGASYHGNAQMMSPADEPYMYGVAGGAAGGRFVAVPSGQENEFQEMFKTIMSFSREDYAGEAVRSHEAVLMEALRDAGLA